LHGDQVAHHDSVPANTSERSAVICDFLVIGDLVRRNCQVADLFRESWRFVEEHKALVELPPPHGLVTRACVEVTTATRGTHAGYAGLHDIFLLASLLRSVGVVDGNGAVLADGQVSIADCLPGGGRVRDYGLLATLRTIIYAISASVLVNALIHSPRTND